KYSIDVGADAVLEFSFIGYATQEVVVNGRSVIDVKLVEDTQALDEVVVVGYGTVRKKDATGSVETLKAADFNKGVTTSPQQLLQGRVAGVNIVTASGEPGSATNIRIRGATSLRAGNNPLVVVDGVPLDSRDTSPSANNTPGFGSSSSTNPLEFINSDDIASIDILKDASATAIYGSRGANGVILITTKRGKSGKTKVTLSTSVGFSEIANTIDVLSGREYAAALASEGGSLSNDFGDNVDPINEITQTGVTQNYNVSFAGGNEKNVYRVSFGYLEQEGIIKTTELNKYSASFNDTYKLMDDRLKIDTKVIYGFNKNSRALITNNAGSQGSLIGTVLSWNPTLALRNGDGTIRQSYPGSFDNNTPAPGQVLNPLALLEYNSDNTETSRIVASIAASFEIIEGLTYKFNFGVDRSESTRRASLSRLLDINGIRLDPATGLNGGRAEVNQIDLFAKTFEHTLNYIKDVGENLNVNVLGGYAYQELTAKGSTAIGTNIDLDPGNGVDFLGGFSDRTISSFRDPNSEIESVFGRVNLSAYDKYLFTGTIRADGSSKFGENNKWGYFPAFAFAWKISEEDFAPDIFTSLKLRAGWGQTGNQEFPAGAAQERFQIGFDANGNTTSTLINVANPDLQWETTTTTNVGIDFSVVNNRISGSVDYFYKETEDLLFQQDVIQPAPATKFWVNLPGKNVNSGVELTLSGKVIDKEDLSFDLSGNISFLDNELQDFPFGDDAFQTGDISGPGLSNPQSQRLANNQPINVFKMAVFMGFDSSGNPVYKDGNGGLTTDANLYKEFVGDPNPDIVVGFNANLNYKNWALSANLNGQYGGVIYNNTRNASLIKSNLTSGRNISPLLVGNSESVSSVNALSTRYLESGDFLRLSNLLISYDFTKDMLPKYVSSIRVYATGQNLFVISPYSGFDPEVNTSKASDGVPSFGIEYQPYPRARTYSFGVNVSF
ncbi:MAG TPA: SusC/RagA family TonB-linked outer membrane protein, partial [Flavobacteriia bacterium]|nr:SusC/RagA family TonB-linked outer membrane protein [Flavobacteriia bacterium]